MVKVVDVSEVLRDGTPRRDEEIRLKIGYY